MKLFKTLLPLLLCLSLCGCQGIVSSARADLSIGYAPEGIVERSGTGSDLAAADSDVIVVNGNSPDFSVAEIPTESFELYSGLDQLGRCGASCALVGPETLPIEERGDIGEIEPSGWLQASYKDIEGGVLYNRSHLIMNALGGEDDVRNLITGTRYMNASLMLEYEMEVLDYVESTGNHVLYRVTPLFEGSELVARGVQMEAYSVEDGGQGVCFNVVCRNVQPGIEIDYATGESRAVAGYAKGSDSSGEEAEGAAYVLNTNSMRFHEPECGSVSDMSERNRKYFHGTRDEAFALGYKACGSCKP